MKDEHTSQTESVNVSRRAMLRKSAKYAALIPAAALVASKASAHTGYSLGSGAAIQDCIDEHTSLGFKVTSGHCTANHGAV